ncbi:MAG: hypothetical protein IPM53_03440 [Anaerolineaceae bacterium]|nr:hypothetical protein [Anaerolineaceae bacterium]
MPLLTRPITGQPHSTPPEVMATGTTAVPHHQTKPDEKMLGENTAVSATAVRHTDDRSGSWPGIQEATAVSHHHNQKARNRIRPCLQRPFPTQLFFFYRMEWEEIRWCL